jgi:hypothetical protein
MKRTEGRGSCRGEAFANSGAAEQTAVSQMRRPYATPCVLSPCFVARFSVFPCSEDSFAVFGPQKEVSNGKPLEP